MYIAELHGKLSIEKEKKEDILTSNVFSFFKYTDRDTFLYPFLEKLIPDISREDTEHAVFHFWPCYDDHTEPDLVIVTDKYTSFLKQNIPLVSDKPQKF
jgi:hypothetical protein